MYTPQKLIIYCNQIIVKNFLYLKFKYFYKLQVYEYSEKVAYNDY